MNRNQKFGILILISILLFMVGLYFYFEENKKPNETQITAQTDSIGQVNSDSSKNQEKLVDEEKFESGNEVFTVTEVMPEFPGGQEAMNEFLDKNLKYPQMAKEQGIQGKVWIGFVVDKFGNIKDVEILRGIGGGCDEEAKRVVQLMPRWEPGKQSGKQVSVKFRFPINFILD